MDEGRIILDDVYEKIKDTELFLKLKESFENIYKDKNNQQKKIETLETVESHSSFPKHKSPKRDEFNDNNEEILELKNSNDKLESSDDQLDSEKKKKLKRIFLNNLLQRIEIPELFQLK